MLQQKLIQQINVYLLLILIAVLFLFFPRGFWNVVPIDRITLIAILLVTILFCRFLDKNLIFYFSWFDLLLLGFVSWNFLSFFWATNPSLIWAKSLSWLFIYCFYKVLQGFDFKVMSRLFWERIGILLLVFNMLVLLWFFIDVSIQNDKLGFSYHELTLLRKYVRFTPNYIASFMAIVFPLFFMKWKSIDRRLLFIVGLLYVFLIFLINCRGATLVLLIQLAIIAASRIKQINWLLVSLLGVGLVVLFFLLVDDPVIFLQSYNPFKGATSEVGDDRIALWGKTMNLISENLLIGVGGGNWEIEYLKYGVGNLKISFDSEVFFRTPHNHYLHIFSELGLVGFLSYVGMIVYAILFFFKRRKEQLYGICLLILISYFFVSMFFAVVYSSGDHLAGPQLMMFLVLGLFREEQVKFKINRWVYFIFVGGLIFIFVRGVQRWSTYKSQFRGVERRMEAEKHQKALERLRSIYDPNFNTMYFQTPLKLTEADILIKMEAQEHLIDVMDEALKDHPHYFVSWFRLGEIYADAGNYVEAQKCLEKAHELNNNYFKIHLKLVEVALKQDKLAAAEEWLGFYDKMVAPFLKEYKINKKWQKSGKVRMLNKKYKKYHVAVRKLKHQIKAKKSEK